jgi:hypothetical protein
MPFKEKGVACVKGFIIIAIAIAMLSQGGYLLRICWSCTKTPPSLLTHLFMLWKMELLPYLGPTHPGSSGFFLHLSHSLLPFYGQIKILKSLYPRVTPSSPPVPDPQNWLYSFIGKHDLDLPMSGQMLRKVT